MSKPAKSQWDFGELFPTQRTRKVLSVTELTWQIRRLLEEHVRQVWVTGEITNLRVQSSGHIYFTLKDASAQLSCVLFRSETQVDRALLQDGRTAIVHGEGTVYQARGGGNRCRHPPTQLIQRQQQPAGGDSAPDVRGRRSELGSRSEPP